MNDRAVSLLEQYEIEVLRTRKGRGAILCDTDRGCLIFREALVSPARLRMQDALLRHIRETGRVSTEQIIPTGEGALSVEDGDGVAYVLKTYCEGRELNVYERSECVAAVKLLARLHDCMTPDDVPEELPPAESPLEECRRHNRELKKIWRYLQKKRQKTWFEIRLTNVYPEFIRQALDVTAQWEKLSAEREAASASEVQPLTFCHGDYQYHNILRGERGWTVVGFEHCQPGDPLTDLHFFLRKLLEKSDWQVNLGRELLDAYESVRPIGAGTKAELYCRLAYPEKFWKIVNFYYNSGKAWIPVRNLEKLEKLLEQEPVKREFLERCRT